MKNYRDFLQSKRHTQIDHGINPSFILDKAFDYQTFLANRSIKKGRYANFIDTGLGKTIIELIVAHNYVLHTNKPVLIVTPLAVAFQFIKEAEKFGIPDIEYSKDGRFKSKIVVCNYERLDKFNHMDYDCVILDESSILKNFDGAIKNKITSFLKKVKYRFLFTATPSPNDFVELGTSSEALGYMGYTDMLGKFFTNNEDTIKPQNIGTKWILKGHAKDAFFDWVSSWSVSMRSPSDLGFSSDGYKLPKLITNLHSIKNENNLVVNGQIQMFNQIAKRLTEVRTEQRQTQKVRCEKAVELASLHDTSVYWCNFNKESELISEIDSNCIELKGTMRLEKKEEILLAFADGEIKKLVTKPKITCFGLNWQHCNHTVFFPTFSYEQFYQALRRFYRYGQINDVIADLVFSDGQKRVIDSLFAKAKKSDKLYSILNKKTNSTYKEIVEEQIKFTLPKFL